jgi:hypothetical protein
MKRTVLTFGLLSAAVSVAMMLTAMPLIDAVGYTVSDVLGYASMVVTALVLFFGVRSYREKVHPGGMGFGRALTVGLAIALVASLAYLVVFQLVYFRLWPELGARYEACMIERAHLAGGSAEEIAAAAEQAHSLRRLYDRPLTNAALALAAPLTIGVVAATLSAAVLGRRRPTDPDPGESA